MPMANYVLVVDLGNAAGATQYTALNELMYEFGFTLRGRETLRPAQFSLTSALPLRGLTAGGGGSNQGRVAARCPRKCLRNKTALTVQYRTVTSPSKISLRLAQSSAETRQNSQPMAVQIGRRFAREGESRIYLSLFWFPCGAS
jgi:hypothetical protein